MNFDSTRRFSSRVEDYVRYRPSYPEGVITLLENECGLTPAAKIADIGSGTGLLSELFLKFGCAVIGVEPNADMRNAGDRLLAPHRGFHSVDARAEATGLHDSAVDFVTAGQAFHWFDVPAARSEFRRILQPAGWIALVWNERLVQGPFLEQYEALLQHYSPDYAKVDHRRMDNHVMDALFGPGRWKLASFPNEQRFDLDGVLGRLHSSSYAPSPGSEEYDRINQDVTKAFHQYCPEGLAILLYETKVYYGRRPLS